MWAHVTAAELWVGTGSGGSEDPNGTARSSIGRVVVQLTHTRTPRGPTVPAPTGRSVDALHINSGRSVIASPVRSRTRFKKLPGYSGVPRQRRPRTGQLSGHLRQAVGMQSRSLISQSGEPQLPRWPVRSGAMLPRQAAAGVPVDAACPRRVLPMTPQHGSNN